MTDFVKQPMLWMGFVILVVALIIVADRFENAESTVADSQKTEPSVNAPESALLAAKAAELKQKAEHAHGIVGQNQAGSDEEVVRHQDMLSEEMKQAIRDKLISHGSGETFTGADGTVVLPSAGRSTQVSVAVQMPDGTIEIREYSELPKSTKPLYKVSSQPLK